MKVVYIAKHGSGGNEDEDSISHALRELGHEVAALPESGPGPRARDLAGADLLLFHKWDEAAAVPVLRRAAGVCPRAFWYFDLVDWPGDMTIAARCGRRREWMTAVSPHAEFAFCTDGDWAARMTREAAATGTGPRWVWLPQGADGRIAGAGPSPRKSPKTPPKPLLFTGVDRGGGAGREAWAYSVKRRLGDLVEHHRGGLYREALRDRVAAGGPPAVVLCPDSPVSASYWSNRVYVAAGFGACVLHPWNENLADQYEDGTEVVFYRTVDHMCALAAELVKDHDGLRLLGDAALVRTLRQHTYKHRVERLLKVVRGAVAAPTAPPPGQAPVIGGPHVG